MASTPRLEGISILINSPVFTGGSYNQEMHRPSIIQPREEFTAFSLTQSYWQFTIKIIYWSRIETTKTGSTLPVYNPVQTTQPQTIFQDYTRRDIQLASEEIQHKRSISVIRQKHIKRAYYNNHPLPEGDTLEHSYRDIHTS